MGWSGECLHWDLLLIIMYDVSRVKAITILSNYDRIRKWIILKWDCGKCILSAAG